MDLRGTYSLNAEVDKVWAALFDEHVLAACIPGCQELSQTAPQAFAATVKLKIGPVSAKFKGDVEITDAIAPSTCKLTGRGSGGIAGFAKGTANVTLTPTPDGTTLDYVADAALGGKIASLGSRLMQSTTRKLADQFFGSFSEHLEDATRSSD